MTTERYTDVATLGGVAAPDPAAYGLSPPLFQPLTAYADAAGSSLHQRGGTPHSCDRRAISPAAGGLSQSLASQAT